MNAIRTLSRDEMRNVTAGKLQNPGLDGQVYIRCEHCQNSLCQGWADDCETGALKICGPGRAGTPGPAPHTCVE